MKRNFLKLLATSSVWSSPVIHALLTPAHAQASNPTPTACDADGSLQWNVASFSDTFDTEIVQGELIFRTRISGNSIEIETVASTNPPVIVDFPGQPNNTVTGGTLQSGNYDRELGIATITSCDVLPGTVGYSCSVPPYTIDFQCGTDTLTYIETDVNGNVTTLLLDSPTPI